MRDSDESMPARDRGGSRSGGGLESAVARRRRAAGATLACNATLAILKLAVGLISGSVAILSDGLNSACDLVATSLTFFAVSKSGLPPDPKHPWGHGKYESVAGIIEAGVIFAAGVYIVIEALRDLQKPNPPEATRLGLVVMTFSLVVNSLLSARVLKTARETDSIALRAEGQHILTDAFTSAGVLVSLVISRYLKVPHVQAVAAVLVSVLIFRAAIKVAVAAGAPLVDQALPPDEMTAIHRLLTADPRVLDYHNLRTRRSGPTRLVDVHILLPDDLTFVEAHNHAEALEQEIAQALPGMTDVIIHAEPYHQEQEHQKEHHPEWQA